MSIWQQNLMLLITVLFVLRQAICVKINRLEVPKIIFPGTQIILDCDYTLEGDEGLVVKWYLNEKLIYQWIPNNKPLTLGIFRGRVDLEYLASTETNSVHRALHITHPGPDLSGNYTCLVSTFTSEDRKTKRMLVVATGEDLKLKQEYINTQLMKVTCTADGVYPQPNLNIHVNKSEIGNSVLSIQKRAGLFDVQVKADVPSLTSPEEFSCELEIPEANYTFRKEAMFYPGSTGSSKVSNTGFLIIVSFLLLFTRQ